MPKLLWKDDKIVWKDGKPVWVPDGSNPEDCECCGESCVEYKCGCFTEDPPSPDCAGEWPAMFSNISFGISGLVDTWSFDWSWHRVVHGKYTFPSTCGCYERTEDQNLSMSVSGLAALNGTYGAVLQHLTKDVDLVGPCETYTTLGALQNGTGGETCGTSYDVCNEQGCYLSVFVPGVTVTGNLSKTSSTVETRSGCPPVNNSSSVVRTFNGKAYARPGYNNFIAPIFGFNSVETLRLYVHVLGITNLGEAVDLSIYWPALLPVADPGFSLHPYNYGWTGTSYNIGCNNGRYQRLATSPKYDCFVGTPYNEILGMNIAARNYSGSRSGTNPSDGCPNDPGFSESYSLVSTELIATPSLIRVI